MAKGNVNFQMQGFDELQKLIDEIGRIPQRVVTKSARNGARVLHRAIKNAAPVDTGQLRKGIIVKPEKSRTKGKKFFQVVMSEHMNDVFVKYTKEGKRYYYPASMEYGFRTRDGGYSPGHYFMKRSSDMLSSAVENRMLQTLADELDKLR